VEEIYKLFLLKVSHFYIISFANSLIKLSHAFNILKTVQK